MSQAAEAFQESIKDAEELLVHFNAINKNPPPPNAEVLKRAGLIMALAAWETYVKERAAEALAVRIEMIAKSPVADFIWKKFEEEIKRLNTPNSAKTQKLFTDFLDVDVTKTWTWPGMETPKVKEHLDSLLAKRGDAAHRSGSSLSKTQKGHLVRKEDLEKAIKFLRTLVEKTDQSFDK
ncbi:MAG: HEPN domain-containing protein [Verrucomicrobiota bacterium]